MRLFTQHSTRLLHCQACLHTASTKMHLHVEVRGLQEIVQAMREVIPTLEFTVDCFKVKDLNTEVIELVLRHIPLQATELDVCHAVHAWAKDFFGVDSDDYDSDFDAPEDDPNYESEGLILAPEDLKITECVDLALVKASDIKEVR
jgi:hypothetical protein